VQPRLVFRTHYQVDEPAYLSVLVLHATSPVRSDYSERVAQTLATYLQKQGTSFNIAAAGYAVDLARSLGLINEQNSWTAAAHLLAHIAHRDGDHAALDLRPAERLAYLKVFLEGDGAAMLYLARRVLEQDSLPGDDDWNTIAQSMVLDVYEESLKLTSATADRVALRRELDRLRRQGFSGKTGSHKMFVHLQSMYRIGLLSRPNAGQGRSYAASNPPALQRFCDAVGDLLRLEGIVRESRWADVAAAILDARHDDGTIGPDELLDSVRDPYQDITATGIAICPISAVFDAIQVSALLERRHIERAALETSLGVLQRERPRDVRLHVDRAGRPAFIKLSPAALG
jgi:hypothetical protein